MDNEAGVLKNPCGKRFYILLEFYNQGKRHFVPHDLSKLYSVFSQKKQYHGIFSEKKHGKISKIENDGENITLKTLYDVVERGLGGKLKIEVVV